MKKRNIYIINIIIVIAIVLSLGMKMYYYDKISTAGADLNNLENKLSTITAENEKLALELNNTNSIKSIHERALANGYVKSEVQYLKDLNLASASIN